MGCLGVGLLAAVAAGQSPLTEVWERLERYADTAFSHDQPIDMVVWADEEDPEEIKHWVFVTGYMTNSYGGKFIATYRYDEDNPNSGIEFDYWPDAFATTTVEHKAVAMAFHPGDDPPDDFRLYVTGVTDDGTAPARAHLPWSLAAVSCPPVDCRFASSRGGTGRRSLKLGMDSRVATVMLKTAWPTQPAEFRPRCPSSSAACSPESGRSPLIMSRCGTVSGGQTWENRRASTAT